jgi:hypothetical protein
MLLVVKATGKGADQESKQLPDHFFKDHLHCS